MEEAISLAEEIKDEITPAEQEEAPLGEQEETPLCEQAASAPTEAEDSPNADEDYYDNLMASDLARLKAEFPELSELESLTELSNPLRYGALRDLGLSPAEAYLASSGSRQTSKRSQNNRAHLIGAVPTRASIPSGAIMNKEMLKEARELFSDLTDAEIQSLYRRVTG